jgi:hypothetical protein
MPVPSISHLAIRVTSMRRLAKSALARSGTVAVAASALVLLVAPPSIARPAWDDNPVHVRHDVKPQPKVTDLRVGAHRNFDRVVIDLAGKVPGYDVRYVRHLSYEGTGDRVPLKGKKFIAVALTPAKAHDARGRSVYTGPKLTQYAFDTLRGAAFTGDFEGVVSLGLSLSHRADFRVTVLHAPNRIVIDLKH